MVYLALDSVGTDRSLAAGGLAWIQEQGNNLSDDSTHHNQGDELER